MKFQGGRALEVVARRVANLETLYGIGHGRNSEAYLSSLERVNEEDIAAAQLQRTYVIKGSEFARVAFGSEDEDWGAERGPCHDCGAVEGELHLIGCDVERCPRCGGQSNFL